MVHTVLLLPKVWITSRNLGGMYIILAVFKDSLSSQKLNPHNTYKTQVKPQNFGHPRNLCPSV